jgi:hypothetical protein
MLYLAFLTTLLLLVALAAALVQPEWAHDLGLDGWNTKAVEATLFPEHTATDEFDDEVRTVQQLLQERQRVVDDLLDGRVTACEAVEAFRRLNERYGKPRYDINSVGGSQEEYLHRHLLRWVRTALETRSPGLSDYLVAHFESELRCQRSERRTH